MKGSFDATLEKYKPAGTVRGESNTWLTPADIMRRFYEHRSPRLERVSEWDYLESIEYLEAAYGRRDVTTLRDSDLLTLVAHVRSLGLSPRTLKDRLTRISSAWDWAKREGLVRNNVFRDAPSYIKPEAPVMRTAMDPETVGTILDWVAANRPQYAQVLLFIAKTGCRPGEAVGLQWQDVTLDNTVVGLRSSKTRRTRSFVVPESVQRLLEGIPRGNPRDHVFLNNRGSKFTPRAIREHGWNEALKALGLGELPLYTLRRSFVTNMMNAGYPVAYIAQITGHSPDVLVRYYLGKLSDLPEAPDL